MYDNRNNLSRQVEKDARDNLGEMVFKTKIPRNVRVSEAPSYALCRFCSMTQGRWGRWRIDTWRAKSCYKDIRKPPPERQTRRASVSRQKIANPEVWAADLSALMADVTQDSDEGGCSVRTPPART